MYNEVLESTIISPGQDRGEPKASNHSRTGIAGGTAFKARMADFGPNYGPRRKRGKKKGGNRGGES